MVWSVNHSTYETKSINSGAQMYMQFCLIGDIFCISSLSLSVQRTCCYFQYTVYVKRDAVISRSALSHIYHWNTNWPQYIATTAQLMVESRVQGGYHSLKLNVVQRRPQFEIVVLSERVKVLFNGSREDNRILRGRDRGLKESKSEKTSTIILLKSVCLYVGVRKLQVVIHALSSREMYLTVRIVWQYILSRHCRQRTGPSRLGANE